MYSGFQRGGSGGGGSGDVSTAQLTAAIAAASPVAQAGGAIDPGEVVLASDTKLRLENATTGEITPSGTTQADLEAAGLTPATAAEPTSADFYTSETAVSLSLIHI